MCGMFFLADSADGEWMSESASVSEDLTEVDSREFLRKLWDVKFKKRITFTEMHLNLGGLRDGT